LEIEVPRSPQDFKRYYGLVDTALSQSLPLAVRGLAEIQLYKRLMTNFRRRSNATRQFRINHRRRHLGGVIIVLLQFNTWALQCCGQLECHWCESFFIYLDKITNVVATANRLAVFNVRHHGYAIDAMTKWYSPKLAQTNRYLQQYLCQNSVWYRCLQSVGRPFSRAAGSFAGRANNKSGKRKIDILHPTHRATPRCDGYLWVSDVCINNSPEVLSP